MGSSLLPIGLGLIRVKILPLYLQLLLLLAGVALTCDLLATFHHELNIKPNYFGDAYQLIEFILLVMIYYILFDNSGLFWPFLLVGFVYVLFSFADVIFFQQDKINSYTQTLAALIFIVLAVAYFYKLMKDLPAPVVNSLPMFWINIGVLIYFSGNLFVFALTHYLVTVLKNDLITYWGIHNLLGIVKNILFGVGIYWGLRSPTSSA